MADGKGYSMVTWEELASRITPSGGVLKRFEKVLGFEHMAMSVGCFKPGQGVNHHRHEKAEEFY